MVLRLKDDLEGRIKPPKEAPPSEQIWQVPSWCSISGAVARALRIEVRNPQKELAYAQAISRIKRGEPDEEIFAFWSQRDELGARKLVTELVRELREESEADFTLIRRLELVLEKVGQSACKPIITSLERNPTCFIVRHLFKLLQKIGVASDLNEVENLVHRYMFSDDENMRFAGAEGIPLLSQEWARGMIDMYKAMPGKSGEEEEAAKRRTVIIFERKLAEREGAPQKAAEAVPDFILNIEEPEPPTTYPELVKDLIEEPKPADDGVNELLAAFRAAFEEEEK